MEENRIKQIIEALIFAANKPLPLAQIDEVLESTGAAVIKSKIDALNVEYEAHEKPYRIREIAGGFILATIEEFAPWLKKLYNAQTAEKLSGPALETLAIIAYRQPITKPAIEAIRGVNVDGMLKKLIDRSMVRISGRRDAPGRPFLYATTKEFLEHFGLAKLSELPPIEEFVSGNMDLEEKELIIQTELQNSGSDGKSEQKP